MTVEEQATLRAVCEKWDGIGLSTAPANREEAEQGAVEFYVACGFSVPKKFFWFDSLEDWANRKKSKHGFSVTKPDFHRSPDVTYKVRFFQFHTPDRIGRYVKSSFTNLVEDIVNKTVFRQILYGHDDYEKWLTDHASFGQRDTYWLACMDFYSTSKYLGPRTVLASLMRIVGSCGLFMPGANQEHIGLFERPATIHLDERRRPHCMDGPAIRYRDGFGVYAIHGVPVPGKYIKTPADQINLEELIQEQNAEVRMAVFSKVGFEQLLNKTSHTIISKANGNSLVEFQMEKYGHRLRALLLRWTDKTGAKETVIPVPRTKMEFGADCPVEHKRIINDCEAVRRWTLGWPKDVEILAET